MQHRGDLGATLDLERTDGFTGGDQLVGLLVVGRQLVHLRSRAGASFDHVEGASHQ
jgi:hypothetical protein